jgi:glycosyltransferase involved in cell wall biosynthesis
MIVDQLNTELTGGAATAGYRLHHSLRRMGVRSRFWCARLPNGFQEEGFAVLPRSTESFVRRAVQSWTYLKRKLQWRFDKWRYVQGRPKTLEKFSVPWLPRDTPFDSQILSGDVLQLHWTSKFLDMPSFFRSLPAEHPVVWTLHDMSSFTGGCHHADGCLRFAQSCGSCPQLVRGHARDLSARVFAVKLAALRGKNLHIVTPSRWLERLVRQSRILADVRSVQTIYNGLDVQRFKPMDKTMARAELGLDQNERIVAFGAAWLPNRRKGFMEYLEAVNKVAKEISVSGLVFGDGDFPAAVQPNFPIRRVGFLSDPQQQRRVYAAADVFVLSSLGENLAQTGVESLACGTPVVAFDVGGLSEYVRPGETGLLAPLSDTHELARQVHWLLANPEARQQMSRAGRRLVEREFDDVCQAEKYLALYRSLAPAARIAA